MRYDFFDRDGVEHVRLYLGLDTLERVATKEDHAAAETAKANAAAAMQSVVDETVARVTRENENTEGTQNAPQPKPDPQQEGQKMARRFAVELLQLLEPKEHEFDAKRASVLGDFDAEDKSHHKHKK